MKAEYASATNYLRQLAALVKRPIQWAFLLGLLKTVVVIGQLALLALLAERLFVGGRPVESELLLIAGLAATSLVRTIVPLCQQRYLRRATLIASQRARHQLTHDWQHKAQSGQALAAADGALQLDPIESLKGYFSRYLVQQYLVVASPLIILSVCFYLNTVVGVLLLFSGPIIPVFMALVGLGAEKLSQKHAQQSFALSRVFTDKLRNITTLKLFNAGEVAVNDVAAAGDGYRKATMSTLRIAFLSSAVLEFFSSVAIAGVALYVGFGLLGYIDWLGADQLTLFSGLLVLLLAPEYFAPLRQFAQSYHDRAAAIGAATLLCEINSAVASDSQQPIQPRTQSRIQKPSSPNTLYQWRGLKVNVSQAGGAGGKPIDFSDNEIAYGDLCVINGNSGSGKTTLLKVLIGLMPFNGEMTRSEQATNDIAYFAQQPFLSAGSLRSNMNLFEQHSDEEILAALEQVKLGQLVTNLALGLDTRLAEGGLGLSGGEQRRLALARCLLSRRAVLIADEPTENLDEISAQAIRDCLQEYCASGHTVIVATHDPALIASATRQVRVAV